MASLVLFRGARIDQEQVATGQPFPGKLNGIQAYTILAGPEAGQNQRA